MTGASVAMLIPALLSAQSLAHGQSDAGRNGQVVRPVKELILRGDSFLLAGRPAFLLTPTGKTRPGLKPWIFYAPTLPGLPDSHEKWMHEQFLAAGVAVGGIDVGEAYGSPEGRRLYTEFYRELRDRRGYAPRPCMLGRSRGGLLITSWAAEDPSRISGIVGIYPVFDLRSFPGLARAAPAYGLNADQLRSRLDEFNPIRRVESLARARTRAFLIHGDDDKVVPLRENAQAFLARYQAVKAGDAVRLIVAKGHGHDYWPGFFRSQELVDFAIARAIAGVEPSTSITEGTH